MPDEPAGVTEARNPRTRGIDRLDASGVIDVLLEEQRDVWEAVEAASAQLAAAVEATVAGLGRGGRLV